MGTLDLRRACSTKQPVARVVIANVVSDGGTYAIVLTARGPATVGLGSIVRRRNNILKSTGFRFW